MKKLLGVTLGIMTALGGFVDFGQIVFPFRRVPLFATHCSGPVVVATIAIIVYPYAHGERIWHDRAFLYQSKRETEYKKAGQVTVEMVRRFQMNLDAGDVGSEIQRRIIST